jgi:predicted Co/Zn/Cd cation transporter (cation efflux family)
MIGLEGTLVAAVCLTAIVYAAYMKRVGRRAASQLVLAEADLWIVEGWLSLGVCIAFVLALILSRPPTQDYSTYCSGTGEPGLAG